ncbi:PAS domain-containing sensor histidine kinase [Sediminibacterium sp.]|uniref:PAS domain-containing sensor histidine kinase n=1 Tax=Sediminibacterium sp. TaxID=1917865 RepID=UPI003F709F47
MITVKNPDIIRVLDLSLDLIQIIDLNGIILFSSKSAELILGYTAKELIGDHFLSNTLKEDKDKTSKALLEVREVNKIYNFENRIVGKNKQLIFLSWSLIWDDQTQETFVIGRDITELKRNEEIRQNNEKHYRSLIQNINIGIIIQKENSEITLCNQPALEMLGLTEDQLLGKTSFDPDWNVIHSDGRFFPGNEHPVPTAIATKQPVRDVVMGVYRPNTKDRAWLLVNAEPQFDISGNFDHVICTFTDITKERKSLVQKQAELLDVLDNTAAFFATLDLNFKFTFANKSLLKAIGVSDNTDINEINLKKFKIIDASFTLENLLQKLLTEGTWIGSNTYINKEGKEITVWQVVLLHRNEQHIPTHISVTAIDISASKALEREIHLNKIKTEFVTNVSHEFRTPLTIFRTSMEILDMYLKKLKIDLPEELVKRLQVMDKEIDRLTYVITEFLTVGKMESGKITVNKSSIPIIPIIQNSIHRITLMNKDKRSIALHIFGEPRNILIDEFLMMHVFDNLISNAVKYSKEKKAPEISVYFKEKITEIIIKDYGIGIPNAEKNKLFSSYFRGSNTHNIKGNGLGLVLVKNFINLQNGIVLMESEENIGTTVTLQFPY